MHSTKYFKATFSSAKNNSVKALRHTATWEIKSTNMQIKLVGMQICLFVCILSSSFYIHISFDTLIIFVCWIQKTKCICIIKQISQNTFLLQNKTHANRALQLVKLAVKLMHIACDGVLGNSFVQTRASRE